MDEIIALFKNGWSVSEIARGKGVSLSRVYFVLNEWARISENDIFVSLEKEGVPREESVAIVNALFRYGIKSKTDLINYLEKDDLTNIVRIGPKRSKLLEDILEKGSK